MEVSPQDFSKYDGRHRDSSASTTLISSGESTEDDDEQTLWPVSEESKGALQAAQREGAAAQAAIVQSEAAAAWSAATRAESERRRAARRAEAREAAKEMVAAGLSPNRKLTSRTFAAVLPRGRSRTAAGHGGLPFASAARLRLRSGQWVDDEEKGEIEAGCLSPTMRTLGTTAALFTLITLLQVFGALMSNSSALLVDCISMGVDAASYLGSMLVQTQKVTPRHAVLELLLGAVSLGALLGFTMFALKDTWIDMWNQNFPPERPEGSDGEVNPIIVLLFAILGIVFDGISLYFFWRNSSQANEQMSVWTALMHVGADSLRSATTLVMSLMIIVFDVDSFAADAWASYVVGALIFSGAGVGALEWCRQLWQWFSGQSVPFGQPLADECMCSSGSSSDSDGMRDYTLEGL